MKKVSFYEWLNQFEMFSIFEALPEILELWKATLQTDVTNKKFSRGNREMMI